MSGRSWNPKASFASNGLLFGALGFLTTNIGTDPAASGLTGFGGLTGADAAGSVANSGPTFAASITKTANNGEFLVTLQDGYRAVWFADAVVLGPTAGPGDGVHAQVCVPANQGAGNTVGVTFLVTVLDAGGAPVETADRRCQVFLVIKDSASGS